MLSLQLSVSGANPRRFRCNVFSVPTPRVWLYHPTHLDVSPHFKPEPRDPSAGGLYRPGYWRPGWDPSLHLEHILASCLSSGCYSFVFVRITPMRETKNSLLLLLAAVLCTKITSGVTNTWYDLTSTHYYCGCHWRVACCGLLLNSPGAGVYVANPLCTQK